MLTCFAFASVYGRHRYCCSHAGLCRQKQAAAMITELWSEPVDESTQVWQMAENIYDVDH